MIRTIANSMAIAKIPIKVNSGMIGVGLSAELEVSVGAVVGVRIGVVAMDGVEVGETVASLEVMYTVCKTSANTLTARLRDSPARFQ